MPELLFGIVPNTPEPPKYAFKSAPQTPSPLSDMTNTEKNSNQFTPRTTQSEDDSMTPEVEDLVRAPCKLSQSPEESHKPVKLSRRQLKFEDGVTLQSIVQASKEDKIVEVFESNPFCEKKENNFVPLKPQRNRGGVGRGGVKSRKRMEKQDSTAAVTVTGNTEVSLNSSVLFMTFMLLIELFITIIIIFTGKFLSNHSSKEEYAASIW